MGIIVRQTNLAQTIDLISDRAKYDECAKKILTYKAIIAWILKSCTKEFSQYSVNFICNNCLKDDAEISKRAIHQDQLDRDEKLNGDERIEGLNQRRMQSRIKLYIMTSVLKPIFLETLNLYNLLSIWKSS